MLRALNTLLQTHTLTQIGKGKWKEGEKEFDANFEFLIHYSIMYNRILSFLYYKVKQSQKTSTLIAFIMYILVWSINQTKRNEP